jgi:hypothetical protein
MTDPRLDLGFNTPFAEQLAFFRQKLNLPSERWDDITRAAHDRAFMVAGATQADLLADLHAAIGKAIEQGAGIEAFRKDFKAIVGRHGWTGWTGEGTPAGEAWRTKVIYQTNMATSYAAGRYRQMTDPELLTLRPYWRYKHADGVANPRLQHVAWNGLTLPHDHPFWQTHFPPNGWGCHCRAMAVSAREYAKAQAAGLGEAPAGWDDIDERTGAPVGISKGFDYAPGANVRTPLRDFVQDKLITYPDAITTALSRDVTRYINAHEAVPAYVERVLADRSKIEPLWLGFVENFEEVSATVSQDVKGYTILLPAEAPRHVEHNHGHDGGSQRPSLPDDYLQVASVLNEADSLEEGKVGRTGLQTIVAWKRIGEERFRAVFEVRPGKNNRSLALISLVIKKMGGG